MASERPVDRAIREATERGEFDNLPGTGKPLPPDVGPADDMWWVRQFALREDEGKAFLPRSLLLRKEAEDVPRTVARMHTEERVRAEVDDLNRRISAEIRTPTGGPALTIALLDVDAVVAQWRAALDQREQQARAAAETAAEAARLERAARRRRWWRRN